MRGCCRRPGRAARRAMRSRRSRTPTRSHGWSTSAPPGTTGLPGCDAASLRIWKPKRFRVFAQLRKESFGEPPDDPLRVAEAVVEAVVAVLPELPRLRP